jgi:C1A family cysteine protease
MKIIAEHNLRSDATYKLGVNQFSALTPEEFVSIYLGYHE